MKSSVGKSADHREHKERQRELARQKRELIGETRNIFEAHDERVDPRGTQLGLFDTTITLWGRFTGPLIYSALWDCIE